MEAGNEIKGTGNEYTTHFRDFDPRIGRWKSLDPEYTKMPSWSPYNFVFDNPNIYTDQFGDIPWWKLIAGYVSSSKLKPPSASRLHPKLKNIRPHHGLDMPGKKGELIHAAATGKVIAARWHDGYGWTVVVDHGKGILTLYAHMPSKDAMKVKVGDDVKNGQVIGMVGESGGVSTGPHLHVEYIYHPEGGDDYIAPKKIKNSFVFNPMDIGDLQNIIDGKEKKEIKLLDGSTVIIGSDENLNKKEGLYYPTGPTFLSPGKEKSTINKIIDFFFNKKQTYDDDYFDTMDRYEKTKNNK